MTDRIKSALELVDTKSEILAWIILILAVLGFLRGLDDWAAVAMVAMSVALHGYIRRVAVASADLEFKDDL